jgi:hypothetical protein
MEGISSIETGISSIETGISSIETAISRLETAISRLETAISSLVNKKLENHQMIEDMNHMIRIYKAGLDALKKKTTKENIIQAKALRSNIYGVKVTLVLGKLQVSYKNNNDIGYESYFEYSELIFNSNIITDDIAIAIYISSILNKILHQSLNDAMVMDTLLTQQILDHQQQILDHQQQILDHQQQILHQWYISQQQCIFQQQCVLQQQQEILQQQLQQLKPKPQQPQPQTQLQPQPKPQPKPQYNHFVSLCDVDDNDSDAESMNSNDALDNILELDLYYLNPT